LHNPKYIHFGLIHQCDGWRDDRRVMACILSRAKNLNSNSGKLRTNTCIHHAIENEAIFHHPARKRTRPSLQLPGPTWG